MTENHVSQRLESGSREGKLSNPRGRVARAMYEIFSRKFTKSRAGAPRGHYAPVAYHSTRPYGRTAVYTSTLSSSTLMYTLNLVLVLGSYIYSCTIYRTSTAVPWYCTRILLENSDMCIASELWRCCATLTIFVQNCRLCRMAIPRPGL